MKIKGDSYVAILALFGALIGVSASRKRGFSVAAGVIAGLMLGPFAILMFFASSNRKKCDSCDEWIGKKAKVCPYCRNEV